MARLLLPRRISIVIQRKEEQALPVGKGAVAELEHPADKECREALAELEVAGAPAPASLRVAAALVWVALVTGLAWAAMAATAAEGDKPEKAATGARVGKVAKEVLEATAAMHQAAGFTSQVAPFLSRGLAPFPTARP